MNYMTCTACKAIVEVNNTGICLACQQGFNPKLRKTTKPSKRKPSLDDLKNKQEEIEKKLNELNN